MKKIYGFIALMMLLFVGNAQAQRVWDKVSEESVAEIKAGEETLYVLQEGFNSGGWSSSGYLNSGAGEVVNEINTSCVYHFIATGETKIAADGTEYPIYVLKNMENGKYVRPYNEAEGHYTRTIKNAFQFTARKAVEKPAATEFAEGEEGWDEYSNAVEQERAGGAEAAGAWVFCAPDAQNYLSFGANPAIWGYWDTSNWLVYEVKERALTDYEKLQVTYNEMFPAGLVKDDYPVGDQPGYINSQELVDAFFAAVGAVEAALQDPNGAHDFAKLQEDLIASTEAVDKARVQVGEGYYYFIFHRSTDAMTVDGAKVIATQSWVAPEEWTIDHAAYIWQVIKPAKADEGKFYLRNFKTGQYIGQAPGTSQQWSTVADSTYTVSFPRVQGAQFNLKAQNGSLGHVAGHYVVVTWNDALAGGNLMDVYAVDPAVVEKLSVDVKFEQDSLAMNALLESAYTAKEAFKIDTECTFNDKYANAGLVSQFEAANATETREGSEASAFDGNLTTYYHTSWDAAAAPQDDWHWVQVDFGKEVQKLFVKMSQRHNNRGGNPSRYSLVTFKPGEDPDAEVWADTLLGGYFGDTIIYQYPTNFGGNVLDSTTAVLRVDLGRPVQKVRFVVQHTKVQQYYGYGPCWHVSELRFYEDRGDNPRYNMISEEVKAALDAAIAAAEAEVASGVYTEETYEALEEAIDAYYEAYPDTSNLGYLIRNAEAQANGADETQEEIGYFQEGATAELLAVIAEVKAQHEGEKILTKDEITALENKIKDAVKAFWGKLITPEDGKLYTITSASENENIVGNYVYSPNSDLKASTMWGQGEGGDPTAQLNLIWRVEKKDDGTFSLYNLGTGRYMKNIFSGAEEEVGSGSHITQTTLADTLTFAYSGVPGVLMVQLADGEYLNTQPTGHMVNYWDADDINARFKFTEMTDELGGGVGMNMVEASQAGDFNIVTLPYDIISEYESAYKVVGRQGTTLQLSSYSDTEVIPAGTPFVVDLTATEGTALFMFTIAADDLSALEFNFTPGTQNGLVGCIEETELQPGRGLFIDQQVMLSEEGDVVAAGSGYLCGDIPEVEEEGELQFELPGELITAIGNVTIERNEAKGVYSITGVKVRNSQMTKGALKNLPKGVYIIGSKKYIVK